MASRLLTMAVGLACLAAVVAPGEAQQLPTPVNVTFNDAVAKAIARNPSVQQAAAEILRADALLRQVRAQSFPTVAGAIGTTSLSYGGSTSVPQNQLTGSVTAGVPVYAPVQWAQRVQSMDNKQVAELSAADVRRQIAVAAAQAYLAVIARQRVLDANVLARETAKSHYDYARQRRESGAGSRLNELRALTQMSGIDVLVEVTKSELYKSQEALGVLLAEDGPIAATDEPSFELPPALDAAVTAMAASRTDVRLSTAREKAAQRVVSDSWKDWLPSVSALFQPLGINPDTTFQPTWTWRFQVLAAIPVFDGGTRGGKKAEREVNLRENQIALDGLMRQARSEIRAAQGSIARLEQAVANAKLAAEQAHEVVTIVNVSFKVGAITNIEVIDAQRAALDADLARVVADDQLRQARLNLLVALGRFPQ